MFHLLLTLTHFCRTFAIYHVIGWEIIASISFICMEGDGSFRPEESQNYSIAEVRRIIHSRIRQEGKTPIDRIRIGNCLHGIGDRVIVEKFLDPYILFVGTIVDIYYIGQHDYRVIVEQRSGCNLLWYRTGLDHLHASNIICSNNFIC